jgi:hypothetical protein
LQPAGVDKDFADRAVRVADLRRQHRDGAHAGS